MTFTMKLSLHFSTTTKKPSIDHSVADPDMGSQSLGVPSFPTMGSQQRISSASSAGRNKVSGRSITQQIIWFKPIYFTLIEKQILRTYTSHSQ